MFQLADQPDSEGVKGWAHECFGRAKVVDADADSAIFEYTVQKSDCNFSDNFHGGGIATLIDNLTTAAMFTRERKEDFEIFCPIEVNRTDLITLAQPHSTHQLDKLFFYLTCFSFSHTQS